MSDPRLTLLECPCCDAAHWIFERYPLGYPGSSDRYAAHTYACPHCTGIGKGYQLLRQSPRGFFLQPGGEGMTIEKFGVWLRIFETHFPGHEWLERLGVVWYPAEFDARRHAAPRVLQSARYSLSLRAGDESHVIAQPSWDCWFEGDDDAGGVAASSAAELLSAEQASASFRSGGRAVDAHSISADSGSLCARAPSLSIEAVIALDETAEVVRSHRVSFQKPRRIAAERKVPLGEVRAMVCEQRPRLLEAWHDYKRHNERRRHTLLAALDVARLGIQ